MTDMLQHLAEMGAIALTFLLVANPIGTAPVIMAVIKDFPLERQRAILRREAFFALILALFFQYFGKPFLNAIQVKSYTVSLAGSVIVLLVALGMIFSKRSASQVSSGKDPYFVPIATPMISGPGLLTMVMLYGQQYQNPWLISGALLLTWIGIGLCIMITPQLFNKMGPRGIVAIEQLMGMVLILIGVEMGRGGVNAFIQSLPKG